MGARRKYQVLLNGWWHRCRLAKQLDDGSLQYTLFDRRTGVASAMHWTFKR